MNRIRHVSVASVLCAVLVFIAACFILLAFSGGRFDGAALLFGLLLCLLIIAEYISLLWIAPHADRILFILIAFLTSLGMAVQYRMGAESALHQLLMALIGGAALCVAAAVMKRPAILRVMSIPFALTSLLILVALLFVGKESGGARNWISVGGFLFQPSEFVKVALIAVLAGAMTRGLTVKKLIPAILFTLGVAALLVLQRDLGAAMLVAGVFLILFYAATGKLGATFLGLAAGGAGAYAGYLAFDHVKARVGAWLDPWATYSTSGYQIAQGLMAIASGGLWGEGLGLGSPGLIPAYRTDYVFAVICEEFGIVFGIGVIAVYALVVVRGVMIALASEDRFSSLCAFGCASLVAVQTFIIIGGVIKLIPLTGITMPFVSYGGSSLIAFMTVVGILQGVAARNGAELEKKLREAAP
ncbi:MAG TPA: FtsW/RodA/SpoVE family cell cycle protein [Clostridia bacterium]|nr:FtsW/RodA/SpoVE family cell cycle protein [Clostridia bacterium]HPK14918.1 FtsW/RodA/SpoVE family cell cycle protein [Clostridia bacterium]